jgi:hypothetical protein
LGLRIALVDEKIGGGSINECADHLFDKPADFGFRARFELELVFDDVSR